MSVRPARHEDPAGIVPGELEAADLAEVWLIHALDCLLEACEVAADDRPALIESRCDSFEAEDAASSLAVDEPSRLRRLDACRRALAFSALAVEARLNRVLRRSHAGEEWAALLRLPPADRFRLVPRLLDEREREGGHAELCDRADEVFGARDELVDASGAVGALSPRDLFRLGPRRAWEAVEASAEICSFLAPLTGEDGGSAPLVRAVAHALSARAKQVQLASTAADRAQWGLDWNGPGGFPPDVIGS